ncbi:hypothetical protein BIM11_6225 [Burkholderia pseudomallei]|nr:hypothetical protein BIM11_6225 [Burkholderia pseudomallei]
MPDRAARRPAGVAQRILHGRRRLRAVVIGQIDRRVVAVFAHDAACGHSLPSVGLEGLGRRLARVGGQQLEQCVRDELRLQRIEELRDSADGRRGDVEGLDHDRPELR